MVKSIAIIPARSGSKRLPDKNIYPFFDKPMIAYTIEACIASQKFDKILVSTDSEKYADIAKQYGAEVPFLRNKYNDDFCTVSESVLYSLHQAEEFYNEQFNIIALAMANCPIRNYNDIINGYENFVSNGYESQISCFKYGYMKPWWAIKLDKNHKGTYLHPEIINKRSQNLEELFCPTGALWICKADHLKKYSSFYGNHNFWEINWKSAVDIDDYEDLEFAKAIHMLTNLDKS